MGRTRRVICLEDNKVYDSVTDASKAHFISPQYVTGVCKGTCKSAAGYHFAYVDEEVKGPTQHEKILDYLKEHGGITQREALKLGIYRLSSRIFELKQAGHKIKRVKIVVQNKDGTTSTVARYEEYADVGNEAV